MLIQCSLVVGDQLILEVTLYSQSKMYKIDILAHFLDWWVLGQFDVTRTGLLYVNIMIQWNGVISNVYDLMSK